MSLQSEFLEVHLVFPSKSWRAYFGICYSSELVGIKCLPIGWTWQQLLLTRATVGALELLILLNWPWKVFVKMLQ